MTDYVMRVKNVLQGEAIWYARHKMYDKNGGATHELAKVAFVQRGVVRKLPHVAE